MRVTADTSRIDWREIGAVSATPDIEARSGRGEKMSYARFNLQSGAEVPQHGHDNEEFGFVISGSLDLWVADLYRIRVGPLTLGDLPEGRWRPPTAQERAALIKG